VGTRSNALRSTRCSEKRELWGRALGRPDYIAAAVKNATFITTQMKDGERLLRSWKDGPSRIQGYREDYAMVGAGLLAL